MSLIQTLIFQVKKTTQGESFGMDVREVPGGILNLERRRSFHTSNIKVLVMGLGKVGLPISCYFAGLGHTVYGYDVNEQLMADLASGINPLRWEDGICLDSIKLVRSLGYIIDQIDFVYVIVPTPTDSSGTKLSAKYVIEARDEIRSLKWRGPIAIGSTLDPRTISEVFTSSPMFYNPPLIRLGHVVNDMAVQHPLLIGWSYNNSDRTYLDRLHQLYGVHPEIAYSDPNYSAVLIGDYLSIALTKLAINTTLSVKISWANEIAAVVRELGGSVSTVFEGLHADPRIGADYNMPGWPACGPCLKRDMDIWTEFARTKHISEASVTGDADTRHKFVTQVVNTVRSVSLPKVAILGITYNPGALDLTKSRGLAIAAALISEDIDVKIYDPAGTWGGFSDILKEYPVVDSLNAALENSNVVVKATDWPEFRNVDFGSRIVIDASGKKI